MFGPFISVPTLNFGLEESCPWPMENLQGTICRHSLRGAWCARTTSACVRVIPWAKCSLALTCRFNLNDRYRLKVLTFEAQDVIIFIEDGTCNKTYPFQDIVCFLLSMILSADFR